MRCKRFRVLQVILSKSHLRFFSLEIPSSLLLKHFAKHFISAAGKIHSIEKTNLRASSRYGIVSSVIVFWTMLIAIKKIHVQVWRRSKQPHDSNISDTQAEEDTER